MYNFEILVDKRNQVISVLMNGYNLNPEAFGRFERLSDLIREVAKFIYGRKVSDRFIKNNLDVWVYKSNKAKQIFINN
jgi:hypothetical protein